MANLLESKQDCRVVLRQNGTLKQSQALQGLIHLFEHRYDDSLPVFWHGVIELAGIPQDLEPLLVLVGELSAHVTLDQSGRKGNAFILAAHQKSSGAHAIFRVAVTGATTLE
ncbi:MAG: hypothetical protein U0872_03515 [Planctomycetaceae bacterium]